MLGRHSTSNNVVAVADIGSGSAGFAIIETKAAAPSSILVAERSILPLEERSRPQTMSGVVRMLSEAGGQVLKKFAESSAGQKLGVPSEVYAVIRAPWVRASAGHAERTFPKEESITKELITEVAREALEKDTELDRANMLDTSVIRVELNEYPTALPLGKRAHKLGVTTFESDCDPLLRKQISDALGVLLPGRLPKLRSGARAYLTVAQEELHHPAAYVIIDMVSEATTCMAVRDGVITHHAIIPEGVRTILRRIAGTEGLSEEMLNLMRMVVVDSCSGEACDTLNSALSKIEPELVRIFGEAVGGFVGKYRLPETLILTAHPDITPWLGHVFSRIDFAQFTITLRPFAVQLLTPAHLKNAVVAGDGVDADNGVMVACAFVNTLRKSER